MPETYTLIPTKLVKKLESFIETLEMGEWIKEDEARELLGSNGKPLAQGTLYNMRVITKKISSEMWRKGVGGNIFYNKKMLMGLKTPSKKSA